MADDIRAASDAPRRDRLLVLLLAALVAATVLLATVLIMRAGGSDETLAAVALEAAPPSSTVPTTATTPPGPPVTVEPAPEPESVDGAFYATRAVDDSMEQCGHLTANTHVTDTQADGVWVVETTVTHDGVADIVSFAVDPNTLAVTALDQLGAGLLTCD